MDATKAANLARAVAAVSPEAWERAGDDAGYATDQAATLGLISQCAQVPEAGLEEFVERMVSEIRLKLPMGEQARYDNAGAYSGPSVSVTRQPYSQALGAELGALAAGGANIGRTIVSPLTGAVGAVATTAGEAAKKLGEGLTPIIIVAALAAIGILWAWSKAKK